MAWYSHTLAFMISGDQANLDIDPQKLLNESKEEMDYFVYAPSRNGCLLWRLDCICEKASNGKNLYLLEDICLLSHEEIKDSSRQLEALIKEIELNPSLVVEAMKVPYQPSITLNTEGFEPLSAQIVYPSDTIIKDGWVYDYTEEKVRRIVDQSHASQMPCPEGDDDGESLLYVFNFLKSHLLLVHRAEQSGYCVVYGEMNQ